VRGRLSVPALLASIFCTSTAALAQVTILGKIVYDLTGSEFDLGLLGLAEFTPALLLVLVVGTVADRFDRRRVVLVGGLGCAAVAVVLALYVGSHPRSVIPIFGLVLVYGVFVAFATPAARSLPADMVEPERLPWLVARDSASWQAAIIAGPVLGGFLYAADIRAPFVAVALLNVAAALSMLLVQTRARVPSDQPPASLDGLRFVRRERLLLAAISLDLVAVLFGGAVTLLPAIAKDRLDVGAGSAPAPSPCAWRPGR
jgi:MFS family permease